MQPADFNYQLPPELIAQTPLASRSASRVLHVPADTELFSELTFADIPRLFRPGDLLILNNTRVVPARLFGSKASGGKIEMLLERMLEPQLALAQLRASKPPVSGSLIRFEGGIEARVEGREQGFYRLRFAGPLLPMLETHGHMPLPPYITRGDEGADRDRYQTVFAADSGAVAAPTAGLHFDHPLLQKLAAMGVEQAFITLHVGAGTFLPLRDEQIRSGKLHAERVIVSPETCAAVAAAHARGGRVIAAGTTVVRALETAALDGRLSAYDGMTCLFIRAGFAFQVVDVMITNFHLPQSSLLMLVSAFRGREVVMAAYRHAVARRFRFFSYGDAMILERQHG